MSTILIVYAIFFVVAIIDIKKGIIPWQALIILMGVITYGHILEKENILIQLIKGMSIGIFLHGFRMLLNSTYKKDTLGMGDIHLLVVITYFLKSIALTLYVIVIGSYITMIPMMILKKKQLPFGPFIVASAIGVSVYQIFFI